MQNVGEKVTGTIATSSVGTGVFGITLTGYELAHLLLAVISCVGWFYFHHHKKIRGENKTKHEQWLRERTDDV